MSQKIILIIMKQPDNLLFPLLRIIEEKKIQTTQDSISTKERSIVLGYQWTKYIVKKMLRLLISRLHNSALF